jgi:hypothetical protein
MNENYFEQSNVNNIQFGQFGLRVLTGNAVVGEGFVAIQAMEDSVISCDINSYSDVGGDTVITSLTLLAGSVIYGRFVNLQVASGKVIAYKG